MRRVIISSFNCLLSDKRSCQKLLNPMMHIRITTKNARDPFYGSQCTLHKIATVKNKKCTYNPIWLTRSSANASCQLKSRQLPRNSAETTCTTSPEQIKVMKLEGYSGAMCNKHVYSTMMRLSCFYCPIGVINKLTTNELWISPVYG